MLPIPTGSTASSAPLHPREHAQQCFPRSKGAQPPVPPVLQGSTVSHASRPPWKHNPSVLPIPTGSTANSAPLHPREHVPPAPSKGAQSAMPPCSMEAQSSSASNPTQEHSQQCSPPSKEAYPAMLPMVQGSTASQCFPKSPVKLLVRPHSSHRSYWLVHSPVPSSVPIN